MTSARFAAAVLSIAACHHAKPPHAFSETPSRAPVRDDPAVRGDFSQPIVLPAGAVPDDDGEHDFPAYGSVRDEQFDLAPSAARDVAVPLTGAAYVAVRASASGAPSPLELAIRRDGAAVATATPVVLAERSIAATGAALDGSGAITIHVANRGAAPVGVTLVIEVAPHGGH